MEEKNCYDCNSRIGIVCMKHAVMLQYENGMAVKENDKEYLQKLCWCEKGTGGTQYELRRNSKKKGVR